MDRPKNCPYPDSCLCLYHTSDEDERLCWGRMPQKKLDKAYKLCNQHRQCRDGEELAKINAADALYDCEGSIAVILDTLAHPEIYNPLPELGLDNPIGTLERRLKGE